MNLLPWLILGMFIPLAALQLLLLRRWSYPRLVSRASDICDLVIALFMIATAILHLATS